MADRLVRVIVFILAGVICLALTSCGRTEIKEDEELNSSPSFIKGADISSLEAVEDYGGKFYDFDGKEVDAIEFLRDNGCNYFRLRVWNHPTQSFDAGDYCSPEHTLETAKRIKAAGGFYLLDFHYSDWWADPKNQTVPAEWSGMTDDEIIQAVYDFTKEVLLMLDEEDAYPDMVQIGNEIGNGLLWNYGSLEHPKTLSAILNSGIRAVRDTTPEGKETKVMIHLQDGGSVGSTEWFFKMVEEQGVTDYDVIGLSYYPYWHGTFEDLKKNIENVYSKFQKQVIVVETAYPFTYRNADDKRNLVTETETTAVGFEASEENQKQVLELIMNSVASCDGGLGVFYWEPAWLAVKGAGVSKGSGNEWENQALFDFEGKALQGIKAFGFEPGALNNDNALYVYPVVGTEIDKNAAEDEFLEELPKTVKVLYSDGSIRETEAEWDIASKKEITETRVAFKGKAAGFDISIGAKLVDKYGLNNLGFEEGNTGWYISGDTNAGWITDKDGYPHEGKWSFAFWDSDDFSVDIYQYVKITETNQYDLQVWSEGKRNTKLLLTLYIADEEGNYIKSDSFQNTGWADWKHPCVSADLKTGEIVRIGVKVEGEYDDWGALDEFTFGPRKE